jgi:hypothetical protein
MAASKLCPSCGKQWPADAPYCGYCATSLHNVALQTPTPRDVTQAVPQSYPQGVDDEYISMFRPTSTIDSMAAMHVRRVDDGLLWAHVQRLTVVVWVRYVLALVCGGVAGYTLITLLKLPDGGDWNGWHVVCAGAIVAGIYLFTSALAVQAQRDTLVMQLGLHTTKK